MPTKLVPDFVEDLVAESNDPGGHFTKVKLIRLTTSVLDELNSYDS